MQPAASTRFADGISGRRLLDLLDRVEAEFEGFQQRVRQRLDRGSYGRSDGGHVTAVVAGGQVNRLELDLSWVARARHTEIAAFVAELIVEASAASTVVGAPPAAAAGSASTLKVIGLVTGIVSLLVTYLTTLSTQGSDLNQRLVDNDAFPRGRWPRSTAELSDASLNDGDDTDWQLRY